VLLAALLLVVQASDTTSGAPRARPTVTIPRVEAEVTIDGNLDEAPWEQAARLTGFYQYEPVDSRPAEERTEVRVWYAPSAIYFGILAYDRVPGAIRATRADRDEIDSDDHVIIYLDTFSDRRRAFFFAVNPLGIQQDGVRSEGAASAGNIFGGSVDRNPDYLYESRGRVTDSGYVVEVKIPFKSLRYPGNGPQSWGINFLRRTQRTGYNDTWTDVRRASASFLLQAGTIDGLHDLQRGLVVEAQPFVTASANGLRDAGTGAFEREDVDPEAGLNLRLGLTNISLDATLNPDFSQVESDVSQVTVNQRFALFFPEKRPFFLEGIELFSTSNQLVYTRQIANPIVGTKLTGKFGNFGVAYLAALDQVDEDGDGDDENVLFNVARLRRDFGSNSLAGVTITDRSVFGTSNYNRVVAGDVRYVFARLYYFEAQLGGSWDRSGGADQLSSPLWKLEYDRTGRSWGFNYQINAIGEDFRTRSGFVNRNNIVTARAFNRLSWYGARGALLENVTTRFGPNRIWRYGDIFGDAIEGSEEIGTTFQFRGGWTIETDINRAFVDFDPADYVGYSVDTGSGIVPFQVSDGVAGPNFSLDVETPTFQIFEAGIGFGYGRTAIFDEGAKATETEIDGFVSLRPTSGLRIEFSTEIGRITRSSDGSEYARTIVPRLKVEYQPTRALFFRVVGDYLSERTSSLRDPRTGFPILIGGVPAGPENDNGFRLDLLASFEPSPGTVAFLGYGSSMISERTLGFGDLSRVSDGFFVKLAYQFRN
jgi:Domain of unknown function (DUF5916)/Carbohydrate family 9 binding domain-like